MDFALFVWSFYTSPAHGFATLPTLMRLPPSGCLQSFAEIKKIESNPSEALLILYANSLVLHRSLSWHMHMWERSYQGTPEPTPDCGGALTPYGLPLAIETCGAGPCTGR